MKHNILYLFIAISCLASCQQEEPVAASDYGYLDLSVQSDGIDVVMTRTEEEDAPLTVELWKGETMQQELTDAEMQDKIRLEVGDNYKIVAYTASYKTSGSWTDTDKGEAVYYAEFPFAVEAGRTTRVDEEVPMINLGVKLVLPEGFETLFPTYAFTARVGERTVALRNGETAYFPYDEQTTAFGYALEATNADGESQTDSGSYETGMAPGTVYTVTYAMEPHTRFLYVKAATEQNNRAKTDNAAY